MSALIGQHLGQYKLVEFLGEGGVASVYRARHLTEKTDVAIKIAKADVTDLNDIEQAGLQERARTTSTTVPPASSQMTARSVKTKNMWIEDSSREARS